MREYKRAVAELGAQYVDMLVLEWAGTVSVGAPGLREARCGVAAPSPALVCAARSVMWRRADETRGLRWDACCLHPRVEPSGSPT